MWRATVGATPVKRWTCAASATFSYGSRGTPFWAKTLKRVPELPKAHDGSSIRWARNDATTAWFPTAWLLITSASVAPGGGYLRSRRSGFDRTRPLCEVSDPTGGWRKGRRRRWRPVVRRSGRGNQDSFKTCLAAPPEAIVLTMTDRLPHLSIDFNYLS